LYACRAQTIPRKISAKPRTVLTTRPNMLNALLIRRGECISLGARRVLETPTLASGASDTRGCGRQYTGGPRCLRAARNVVGAGLFVLERRWRAMGRFEEYSRSLD
jgi:hypothetical protein